MLQEHDRFAILNIPGFDHPKRCRQRQLQHLDVLAFRRFAPTSIGPIRQFIFGDEKMQFLGDGPWAHEDFERFPRRAYGESCFFLRFPLNTSQWILAVEQTGAGLYQQPIRATIDVSGESKLARKHHGAARCIEQQQHGPVAAIISLTHQFLPATVAASMPESCLFENVPIVG
jgi:hypothetical protein